MLNQNTLSFKNMLVFRDAIVSKINKPIPKTFVSVDSINNTSAEIITSRHARLFKIKLAIDNNKIRVVLQEATLESKPLYFETLEETAVFIQNELQK